MKRTVPLQKILWLMPITLSFIGWLATLPAIAKPQPLLIAQEQTLRTLTVTGQGIAKVETTIAQVNLGVEIQGKTAAQVQNEVAKRTSAIVKLLQSRNVEQLQTTGIRLQPNYQYNNNQRNLVGYIGTNTVSFQRSIDKVGALIDEAVTVGATRIDGIEFTATETKLAEAEKEALRNATLDAQEQAETVLKTLNLTSQEIVNIHINGAQTPNPQSFKSERLLNASADLSTPVIGGEQKVSAFVTLEIKY